MARRYLVSWAGQKRPLQAGVWVLAGYQAGEGTMQSAGTGITNRVWLQDNGRGKHQPAGCMAREGSATLPWRQARPRPDGMASAMSNTVGQAGRKDPVHSELVTVQLEPRAHLRDLCSANCSENNSPEKAAAPGLPGGWSRRIPQRMGSTSLGN